MSPRGRELVENEEQYENKKMKSIVVEEQEQEEGSESDSETGFVDLDQDTILNVLERVDGVTLGRAACVNKLWFEVATDDRLWEPIYMRYFAICGKLQYLDTYRYLNRRIGNYGFLRPSPQVLKLPPPPSDFYSIDPQVFSSQIKPWR